MPTAPLPARHDFIALLEFSVPEESCRGAVVATWWSFADSVERPERWWRGGSLAVGAVVGDEVGLVAVGDGVVELLGRGERVGWACSRVAVGELLGRGVRVGAWL